MNYGYARVSTTYQNLDRQIDTLLKQGIELKNIFSDKESGKDFSRVNYQKLFKKLKKGDVLFIKSIDRLGRNYNMILEEWRKLTKSKEIDIVVIDMPLLDTRIEGKNLVGKFIADLVLEILSFVAEAERTNIKERQQEGIKLAKSKGIKFGRPKIKNPQNFSSVAEEFLSHKLSSKEAIQLSGFTKGTFYRRIKEIDQEKTSKIL